MATFTNATKNSETFTNTKKAPAYDNAVAYLADDRVVYLGSIYTCILTSTGNLPTNITYWRTGDRAYTNLTKS